MKSMLVKEFKEMGYRKLGGKKLESYSFYTLVMWIVVLILFYLIGLPLGIGTSVAL